MKADELRLNNLIEYNGVYKKVSSLHGEFITFHTDEILVGKYSYKDSPSLHQSFFKPIPLTEEWLLKFGLTEKIKTAHRHLFDFDEPKFGFNFCLIKDSVYEETAGFRFYDRYIKCKYIHHFQNIYNAFTGEEITIKQ